MRTRLAKSGIFSIWARTAPPTMILRRVSRLRASDFVFLFESVEAMGECFLFLFDARNAFIEIR